jgi:hypothetical protein
LASQKFLWLPDIPNPPSLSVMWVPIQRCTSCHVLVVMQDW